MTTCAECLSALSTTRLSEIPRDSQVAAHVATCPSCSRLVTDMKYADERLALALDSSLPQTPPAQIADNAMISQAELEDRRSVAKWFRRGLAVAAGVLAVMFFRTDTGKYLIGADDFERQTIQLHCISSEDALSLATPYLRSSKGRIYRAGDLRMVTVQGQAQEVEAVLTQIERAEHQVAQCALPAPGVTNTGEATTPIAPKAVNPSDGK